MKPYGLTFVMVVVLGCGAAPPGHPAPVPATGLHPGLYVGMWTHQESLSMPGYAPVYDSGSDLLQLVIAENGMPEMTQGQDEVHVGQTPGSGVARCRRG